MVDKISVYAIGKNKQPGELNLAELQNFSPIIEQDIFQVLELEHSLNGKNQVGGTALDRIFESLEAAKSVLETEKF